MNVAQTVGKGIAWTSLGTVLNKVLVLTNVFIILAHLSVYEYGLTELVLSVLSLGAAFLLPGLTSTIMADMGVERGKGELGKMKSLFHRYMLLNAILAGATFLVLFFGSSAVAHLTGNESIGHFLRIISFALLLSPLRTMAILLATVHARFADLAAYSVMEEAAKSGFLILFFFVLARGPDGLLFSHVLSQLAVVLLFLPRTLSGYRYFAQAHAQEGSRNFWTLLGTHRKWSIASSYAGTLTQNLQLWIIRLMLGTEAVGLYAFASGIMNNVASLTPFTAIFTSLGPKYASERDKFIRLIRASAKAQLWTAFILLLVAFLSIPVLIWAFPKYLQAVPLAMVLLLVLVPTATTAVFTPAFTILKSQSQFFRSMLAKLALTAVIMPLSIAATGLIGIGIGSFLINIFSGIERYRRLRLVLEGFTISLRDLLRITHEELSLGRSLLRSIFSRASLSKLLEREAGTSR